MHTLTIRGMRIALDRAGLYSVSAVVDWLKTGCNELKFFHYGECAEVEFNTVSVSHLLVFGICLDKQNY